MTIDFKVCTERELWEYVAAHLKSEGIDTILVGGSVVSIYTDGLYRSGDLDLVKGSMFVKNLDEAMAKIGFIKQSRHFVHPECDRIFVEFPGSIPLGIGEDYSIKPDEWQVGGETIKILSPTDCVKDRLATYLFFKDRDGFDQAIEVAKRHPIDLEEVKRWCVNENSEETFDEFIGHLK